jgi:hypothetical protein
MGTTGFIDEIEVELEFAGGRRHVDIRFGILNHGVLDRNERQTSREINIGIIGIVTVIDGFINWLETCEQGVDAKKSKKSNLFPRFPGFADDSPFSAHWTCGTGSQRSLSPKDIADLNRHTTPGEIVKAAVRLYATEIGYLVNETKPDVIFCIVPDELSEHFDRAAEAAKPGLRHSVDNDEYSNNTYRHDFHHSLKDEAMGYHTPI